MNEEIKTETIDSADTTVTGDVPQTTNELVVNKPATEVAEEIQQPTEPLVTAATENNEHTGSITKTIDDTGHTEENNGKIPKRKYERKKALPPRQEKGTEIVFAMKFEGEDLEFGKYLDAVISNLIELGHYDTKQAALKMIVSFAVNGHYKKNNLILPRDKEMVIYKPKQKKK